MPFEWDHVNDKNVRVPFKLRRRYTRLSVPHRFVSVDPFSLPRFDHSSIHRWQRTSLLICASCVHHDLRQRILVPRLISAVVRHTHKTHSIRMSGGKIHMFISEDKLCHLFPFAHPAVDFFSLAIVMCVLLYTLDIRISFSCFPHRVRRQLRIQSTTNTRNTAHAHWYRVSLFLYLFYLYKNKNVWSTVKFKSKWLSVRAIVSTTT